MTAPHVYCHMTNDTMRTGEAGKQTFVEATQTIGLMRQCVIMSPEPTQ